MTLALELPVSSSGTDTVDSIDVPSVDELVRDHLPLVGHLVREVANRVPTHVDRDELTSAGMYALVTCAQSFDPTLGASFAGFASFRVRGALTDHLRSLDWASRSVRGRARALDATRDELGHALGRTPTPTEVADAAGMSSSELARLEADAHRSVVVSMQALPGETNAESLPERAEGPESLLLRREQVGELHDAIAGLPPRLRLVVEQYFLQQRRMVDIAAELGVTESRISQLRSEALVLLREAMRRHDDDTETDKDARSSLNRRLACTTVLGEAVPATAG